MKWENIDDKAKRIVLRITAKLAEEQEEERDDNSNHTEGCKDSHRLGIVDNTISTRVSLVHLTNPYRNESQSDVLDIEDKGVCSS